MNFKKLFKIIFIFSILIPFLCLSQIGGYATPLSVFKEDTVNFHLSTQNPDFDFQIFRLGETKELVYVQKVKNGRTYLNPDSSFARGCNWPVTVSIKIQKSWKSGVYLGTFPTWGEEKGVLFTVKEKDPGSHARIVVCLSVNTWQAYNSWGGKSLYQSPDGSNRSYKVAFDRPTENTQFFTWAYRLLVWLEQQRISYEILTDIDIHRNPSVLSNYDIGVIVGHDEYWSQNKRNAFEEFLSRGKKIIVLSGNTCWWQVRYEDKERTLVCYKNKLEDPFRGVSDSLVTVNWYSDPINKPEENFLGTSWRFGGYVNVKNTYPSSKGYGDFTVFNSNHWVYSNTKLKDGDEFGWNSSIVGYEVDGVPSFTWQNGIPTPDKQEGSSSQLRILGLSPASEGYSTMVMYSKEKGGIVFNAGTTDWVSGLATDENVRSITHRVINQFLLNTIPPEIIEWSPSRVASKVIDGNKYEINSRELHIGKVDTTIFFRVVLLNPQGGSLYYRWYKDSTLISTDSIMTIHYPPVSSGRKPETVKLIVYNDHDSTSISWKIFRTGINIISKPTTRILRNTEYRYSVMVVSQKGIPLKYEIMKGPRWITIDQQGTIFGLSTILTQSSTVTIKVSNSEGDWDEQSYTLDVISEKTVLEDEKPTSSYLHDPFPNPFNSGIRIEYGVLQQSIIDLQVFDILGRPIRTFFSLTQEMGAGEYCFEWLGDNDEGVKVASGIYFVRLEVISTKGGMSNVFEKKIILMK